ncbi:MAG: hypothetical protein KDH20_17070 [Rhodocyclaceae bacterium]|nr:hypothetical protein [Rhodocyclaceae bacterium]
MTRMDSHRHATASQALLDLLEEEAKTFLGISARLQGICPSHHAPERCHCRNGPSSRCTHRLVETAEAIVQFCEEHFAAEERLLRHAGLHASHPAQWWSHARDHADFLARLHRCVEVVEHAAPFHAIADLVSLFERFWLAHSLDHDRPAVVAIDRG